MKKYDFSDLQGKSVLVVGGFGHIGKAVCEGFANVRANLIIADLNKDELLLKQLKKINDSVNYYEFDLTRDEKISSFISKIVKRYGKIDVLVNCSWPRTKDWSKFNVEQVPYQSVKKNLIDHLGGYYNVTQQTAKQMKKQGFGSIINFSSIYGLVSPTFSIYEGTRMNSPVAYGLIKGGINTMTKYFAGYFGKDNVRVNCISPGGVYNKEDSKFVDRYKTLTPLGRMATPEDLVMPVLFLASDASKYITGHNLMVDGGWTAH